MKNLQKEAKGLDITPAVVYEGVSLTFGKKNLIRTRRLS
jgi:hypothetical protein